MSTSYYQSKELIDRKVTKAKKIKKTSIGINEVDDWKVLSVLLLKHRAENYQKSLYRYRNKLDAIVAKKFGKSYESSGFKEHRGGDKKEHFYPTYIEQNMSKPKDSYTQESLYRALGTVTDELPITIKSFRHWMKGLDVHSKNIVKTEIPDQIRSSFTGPYKSPDYFYKFKSDEEIRKEKQSDYEFRQKMADVCGEKI